MVHAESDVGEEDSDDTAANDIKSVVSIVKPPRRGDEEGYSSGEECEYHHQDRRGCTARADRGVVVAIIIPLDGELREIGESNGEFGSQPQCQVAESGE